MLTRLSCQSCQHLSMWRVVTIFDLQRAPGQWWTRWQLSRQFEWSLDCMCVGQIVGGEPTANEGHSRGGIHTSGNSASDIICRRETSFMRALDGERVIPWCSFEDLVEMYEPDTRREIRQWQSQRVEHIQAKWWQPLQEKSNCDRIKCWKKLPSNLWKWMIFETMILAMDVPRPATWDGS